MKIVPTLQVWSLFVSGQTSADSLWRAFSVADAEVWTRCRPEGLPWRAHQVSLTAVVIDNGEGPKACPVVRMSRPPKGGGPYVDGLVMDQSWSETYKGVTWGRRALVISWPPVDGRVSLLTDRPVDRSGSGGRHRAPGAKGHFDSSSVQRARDSLTAVPYADVYRYSIRSEPSSNRVVVSVLVADGWTVSQLAASIDNAAMLLVEGRAAILDGELDPPKE